MRMAIRCVFVLFLATSGAVALASDPSDAQLFSDDFESESGSWDVRDPSFATVRDTGDAIHGRVLELAPAGHLVTALFNRILHAGLKVPNVPRCSVHLPSAHYPLEYWQIE